MLPVLRPLSLGELLDQTFQLYRKKFLLFVGIAAVPRLVVLLIQVGYQAAIYSAPGSAFGPAAIGLTIVAGLISLVLLLIATAVSQAATTIGVSEVYLGRDITVGGAYQRIRGSMGRVTLIVFGLGLLTGIGFVLLIVPGIYLMLTWALAIPAAMIEDLGFAECRDRSKALVEGARGRMFLIFVLVFALTYAVAFGILLPMMALAMVATGGKVTLFVTAVNQIGEFISGSLVAPFGMIAFTLAYYDQRVRKEGFDIQLMMAAQAQASASAAVAGHPGAAAN